jgi:hypothetical protein
MSSFTHIRKLVGGAFVAIDTGFLFLGIFKFLTSRAAS